MSRHAVNVSAVILKDLRQYWPLAVLTASAVLAHTLGAPVLENGLHNAAFLISGVFIVALVQQDAPASLRHDWLTRPVGGLDVLLAKLLLAAMAILLPAIIGSVLSAGSHGTAFPEALLLAIAGMKLNLLGAFLLVLVAAVTSTLVQAAGVLTGLVLLWILTHLAPGRTVWDTIILIALAGGAVVLWLQYAQRRTIAARGALGVTISIVIITMALLVGTTGNAHSQTTITEPAARPAIDGIMAVFRDHPLVGLGDDHGMAQEEDFYAALVRDPRFAREVGNVVVEFGNAAQQDVIDRFVDGQAVPYAELRKVWTDPIGWAPPPFKLGYVNLFAQIRATNQALPAGQRIHVWLGDPPLDWSKVQKRADAPTYSSAYRDVFSSGLIEREILGKGRKALLIFGHFHFNRDDTLQSGLNFDTSMAQFVERQHPGALFVVIPYGGFLDKNCNDEFERSRENLPAPTLLTPVRGTALDDAAFRQHCPAFKVDTVPPAFRDRFLSLLTGAASDALLYLGPAASLARSPLLPDAYIDDDYRKEILRHWSLFGMGGNASDMVVEKNSAAPRPFTH